MSEMTLAELRRKTGLSQSQVAAEMGISVAQVSKMEAMYPKVMFNRLRAYMDAIGVEIRYLDCDVHIDLSSSEVVEDSSRILALGRRKDPTRGGLRSGH